MLLVLRGLEAYTADHSCDLDAIGQDRGRRVCGSVDQRLVLLLVSLSPPPSRNGADGLEDRPRLGNRTLPARRVWEDAHKARVRRRWEPRTCEARASAFCEPAFAT